MNYKHICEEFHNNKKYLKLDEELHHGTTRFKHINKVAFLSYYISRFFKIDYVSSTRGALMHDFFYNKEYTSTNHLKNHPLLAYNNSNNCFKLNAIEKDIILTHMFPVTFLKPKYVESYIVSICDKIVSIYEFIRYKIPFNTCVLVIFMMEFIK